MDEKMKRANERELKEKIANLNKEEMQVVLTCIPTKALLEELFFRTSTMESIMKDVKDLGNNISVAKDSINWEIKM